MIDLTASHVLGPAPNDPNVVACSCGFRAPLDSPELGDHFWSDAGAQIDAELAKAAGMFRRRA